MNILKKNQINKDKTTNICEIITFNEASNSKKLKLANEMYLKFKHKLVLKTNWT